MEKKMLSTWSKAENEQTNGKIWKHGKTNYYSTLKVVAENTMLWPCFMSTHLHDMHNKMIHRWSSNCPRLHMDLRCISENERKKHKSRYEWRGVQHFYSHVVWREKEMKIAIKEHHKEAPINVSVKCTHCTI